MKFAKLSETKIVRRAIAVMAALSLACVSVAALSGCQKEETPTATITVMVTDEMAQSLADQGITDAAAWLKAAGAEFAAQYQGVIVTVNVVTQPAAVMKADLEAGIGAGLAEEKTVGGYLKQAFADEPEDDAEGADLDGENGENGENLDGATDPAEGEDGTDADPEGTEADGDAIVSDDVTADPEPVVTVTSAPADASTVTAGLVMDADVLFGSFDVLAPAIYTGKAVALDGLVTEALRGSLFPAALAAGTAPANGATYLLPFSFGSYVLVVDADLLAACELGDYIVKKEPAVEELSEVVEATTAEGDETAGPVVPEPITAQTLVDEALATAVIQTWTAEQWKTVLDTMAAKLPGIAQARLEEAVNAWSVEVEKARLAAEEAGEDPDKAAEKFGSQPTIRPLFPLMYWGQGTEQAQLLSALMGLFGSTYTDDEGFVQVETPEGVAAIKWLQYAAANGILPAGAADLSYADNAQLFADGQLGVFVVRSDQIDDLFASVVVEVTEEAQEEGAQPTTTLQMSRDFCFVALPVFSAADVDAMTVTALAAATAQEEGTALPRISGETGARMPMEVYGFAVMDNGDDLTLQIAQEFVAYVMGSDTWKAYAATTTAMPAFTDVMDDFAQLIPLAEEFVGVADCGVNLSANVPGWDASIAQLPAALSNGVYGGKLPVEAAASINKACNPPIEAAARAAKLHE